MDELRRLRSELPSDTSLEQPALQMSLQVACRLGDEPLAATALALGGDPAPRPARILRGNGTVNEHGMPPLHHACLNGHTRLVGLLLEAKAPPTLLSNAGVPPLVVAAQHERSLGAISLLLAANAPLAMRDDRRQTALHMAARAGNVQAAVALLAACVDAEASAAEETTDRAQKEPTSSCATAGTAHLFTGLSSTAATASSPFSSNQAQTSTAYQ